jgi:potassium channel subfamily K
MLSQLVSFLSSRTSDRKEAYQKAFRDEYSRRREEEEDDDRKHSLVVELAEMQRIEHEEDRANQLFDLLVSLVSLLVFWCVGAAIFHAIEGWAIGSGFSQRFTRELIRRA